jgi:hypothetical protein
MRREGELSKYNTGFFAPARRGKLVDLVHLVRFVHLVCLAQPNKLNKPNKREQPVG